MNGRSHSRVIHPDELLAEERRLVGRVNDWAATHLAIVFGLVWTVWAFMVFPLALLLLPSHVQSTGFFISSGWIQLWALPLFVYVGNKLQKSTDAQSEAQHHALTHIAHTVDAILARSLSDDDVKALADQLAKVMAAGAVRRAR